MYINLNDKCWCGCGKNYKECHFEFDRKLQKLGKNHKMIVPSRDLIKMLIFSFSSINKIKVTAKPPITKAVI